MGARLSSFALAETQKAEMSQFHAPQFFFISQRTFAYSCVLCGGGSYNTFHEEMRASSNAGPAHVQFRSSSISQSFDFKMKLESQFKKRSAVHLSVLLFEVRKTK